MGRETLDMPRISIIVPAYNAQDTIVLCLKSLLESDLKEIEVIVVDDGSGDETFQAVQTLQKNDSRIRLFWQENSGVSAARNLGIQMARGEYLGFCDSDDWVEPGMYSTMLQQAEDEDVNLVVCDHCKDNGGKRVNISYGFPSRILKGEDYRYWLKYALTRDYLEYPITCSSWACLFEKKIVIDNRIKYPIGITNGEDYIFGAHFTACAKSMLYLKGFAPYHYCCTPGSASKARSLKMITNSRKIIPLIYETFHKYSHIPDLDDQIFLSQVRYIGLSVNKMIEDNWELKRVCRTTRDLVGDIECVSRRLKTNYQFFTGQKILLLSIQLNVIEMYVFAAYIKNKITKIKNNIKRRPNLNNPKSHEFNIK